MENYCSNNQKSNKNKFKTSFRFITTNNKDPYNHKVSVLFGDLVEVKFDSFLGKFAESGVLCWNDSNFNIVTLELLTNDSLQGKNGELDSIILFKIPASLFLFLFQVVDSVLFLDSWSNSLVAKEITSWINFVKGWSFFEVNSGDYCLHTKDSLHCFLSSSLVIVGKSWCEVIDWDVMTQFSLEMSSLHLESGDDVFAIG